MKLILSLTTTAVLLIIWTMSIRQMEQLYCLYQAHYLLSLNLINERIHRVSRLSYLAFESRQGCIGYYSKIKTEKFRYLRDIKTYKTLEMSLNGNL